MTTYRQMVYIVLDLLKEVHDDAYYTEEHVIFLLDKMRSLLLLRKHAAAKRLNEEVPDSNYQQLCLNLEPTDILPEACGGEGWLRSTKKVPSLLGIGHTSAYPVNMFASDKVTFIAPERMPFVGYNKWLKNIIYVAIGPDDYLYVKSINPQFRYLNQMRLRGIFEDSEKASELACEGSTGNKECDILDMEFPLEEGLQMPCIEYVVQELSGARFAPQDKTNNAEDGLAKVGSTRATQPVARYSDAKAAAQAEDEQ